MPDNVANRRRNVTSRVADSTACPIVPSFRPPRPPVWVQGVHAEPFDVWRRRRGQPLVLGHGGARSRPAQGIPRQGVLRWTGHRRGTRKSTSFATCSGWGARSVADWWELSVEPRITRQRVDGRRRAADHHRVALMTQVHPRRQGPQADGEREPRRSSVSRPSFTCSRGRFAVPGTGTSSRNSASREGRVPHGGDIHQPDREPRVPRATR